MYSSGCIVQDNQTGKILRHSTEKNGLYYVDQMSHQGYASLARGSVDHQLWLWYCKLGNPSLGYLRRLFSLVS